MATQDYTSFLGKQVTFLNPITHSSVPNSFSKVSGIINGIVLFDVLPSSEFFVEDNTYLFSEVIFIDELPSPLS